MPARCTLLLFACLPLRCNCLQSLQNLCQMPFTGDFLTDCCCLLQLREYIVLISKASTPSNLKGTDWRPCAAYYAHLAAARGRCMLSKFEASSDTESLASGPRIGTHVSLAMLLRSSRPVQQAGAGLMHLTSRALCRPNSPQSHPSWQQRCSISELSELLNSNLNYDATAESRFAVCQENGLAQSPC